MMHFSKTLKTAALAGLVGLGFVAASTSPAMADRSYVRCDRDGDRCWRVVCDWDGDDCRTYRINSGYYGYRGRYGYGSRYNNYNNSYYNNGRRWVCDRDGATTAAGAIDAGEPFKSQRPAVGSRPGADGGQCFTEMRSLGTPQVCVKAN